MAPKLSSARARQVAVGLFGTGFIYLFFNVRIGMGGKYADPGWKSILIFSSNIIGLCIETQIGYRACQTNSIQLEVGFAFYIWFLARSYGARIFSLPSFLVKFRFNRVVIGISVCMS